MKSRNIVQYIACQMVIGTVRHQGKGHRYEYGFSFIQDSQEADPAEVPFGDKELKKSWSNLVWLSEVFLVRENGKCKSMA